MSSKPRHDKATTNSGSLNVIALISGGKDSIFSILHCLANGHHVVALANLHPHLPSVLGSENGSVDEGEDMNSFMYQTVGHSIVPLYSEALGIPLYRQEIEGVAVNTSREYKPSLTPSHEGANIMDASQPQDETESLVPLLKRVLEKHPEANAISTGAILSTYQRTRVESVAIRLNLVPLSFLWQYPSVKQPYTQSLLLEDMARIHQESRIIKVASGGLDESFLWANVSDPKTVNRLKRSMGRFGPPGQGAVLGEGGEFETLAVDGPRALWKKRIQVDVVGTTLGEGGNAAVKFGKVRCAEKNTDDLNSDGLEALSVPDIWDPEALQTLHLLDNDFKGDANCSSSARNDGFNSLSANARRFAPSPQLSRAGSVISISNLTSSSSATPSSQLNAILSHLHSILACLNATPSSIASSILLLRSMSAFTTINPIYGSFFTEPLPPSRVTIACGDALGEGVEIMLSVTIITHEEYSEERLERVQAMLLHFRQNGATVAVPEPNGEDLSWKRGLHVQSRSYWAPANIGPYSQAIAAPIDDSSAFVHLAGQIPLVPATMEMISGSFEAHTTLSLQHLWRIGRAMGVTCWSGAVAFIDTPMQRKKEHLPGSEEIKRERWCTVIKAWRSYHSLLHAAYVSGTEPRESDEQQDIWDLRHGLGASAAIDEGDSRPPLPDWERVSCGDGNGDDGSCWAITPCFVAEVDGLPRVAPVEWTSIGITSDSVGITHFPVSTKTELEANVVEAKGTNAAVGWISVRQIEDLEKVEDVAAYTLSISGVGPIGSIVTIYSARSLPESWVKRTKATVIPCRRVWGGDGELSAVVNIRRPV